MVDLRAQLLPVKSQGRRETCLAFAATAAHEHRAADRTDLSAEYLHWACKRADGLASEATTLAGLMIALPRVGQCRSALWAYDDSADQWALTYRPTLVACRDAWGRRRQTTLTPPPVGTALRDALDRDRPPVLGLELFETWHHPTADGRIRLPTSTMPALGGHAVVVVGYGDIARTLHYTVRNSWGTGWADAGYGYLPAAYVDRYAIAGVLVD